MRQIGVDFCSTMKIVNGVACYTGGANYALQILKCISEYVGKEEYNIIIYALQGFKFPADVDLKLEHLSVVFVLDLLKADLSNVDILFLPQVNGTVLYRIPLIKRRYNRIKIYATIHDKQHNMQRFDKYDCYYASGIKGTIIYNYLFYIFKRIIFSVLYAYCIKSIDKIFTVSNYSMQMLMHKNIRSIKYYIQENFIQDHSINISRGDYALFVSGGRSEKNLLRTLEAFCLFVNQYSSDLKLVVTGVNENLVHKLSHNKCVDSEIIKTHVTFCPYVTYDELCELYGKSRFVIFMSKNEGYGLPVREAMNYGKAVLSSNLTSIPEVAGAASYYVNPFDVNSIVNGLKFYSMDSNVIDFENYISRRNKLLEELTEQDSQIFLRDFFYDE